MGCLRCATPNGCSKKDYLYLLDNIRGGRGEGCFVVLKGELKRVFGVFRTLSSRLRTHFLGKVLWGNHWI